ncbi:MAG TPA: CHAT domain-containing protein [Dermatophilaceae bacterium]|nr:CHAT domain-containing protein [Dermatophilaceae bacterium]
MFAEYSGRPGGGGKPLPRVALLRLEPVRGAVVPAPAVPEPVELRVSIREEGAPLAWSRTVSLPASRAERMLQLADQLQRWARGDGLTAGAAASLSRQLGRDLFRSFLGTVGAHTLDAMAPTALLIQVDETLVNLPWELLWRPSGPMSLQIPVGRVVTSSSAPLARRDPVSEDPTLRILAVANPTQNLPATEAEIEAIRGLAGSYGSVTVTVTVLERDGATVEAFRSAVEGQDFDLLHFAGHASFDSGDPRASALLLADGRLRADQVARLPWSAPPYVVFNSACESARAVAGDRLFTRRGRVNGLAAAFLSAGVEAYLGHYWPVGDSSARRFAEMFYTTLFSERSIGAAVFAARRQGAPDYFDGSDLTALGAVYFGDPGGARVDVTAMAS